MNAACYRSRVEKSIVVIGRTPPKHGSAATVGRGFILFSILDGIREKVGSNTIVRHVAGPGRITRELEPIPALQLSSVVDGNRVAGLRGEYFDNNALSGQPKLVRTDAKVDFGWTLSSPARGIPFDWYSVRWTGRLTIPASGAPLRRIGVVGNDGYRLSIDGKLVIDNWRKQSFGTHTASVSFAPGSTHDVVMEYFESTGNARVKLVWDAGVRDDWNAKIDSAVAATRRSDVAVVVAGLEEGEFRDRSSLRLPGHQEALIQRVAATGKPVVVVLVGGSAITMSNWLDRVGGVLDVWYPGEEGGHAVADVLYGDTNPAGRLPITFPWPKANCRSPTITSRQAAATTISISLASRCFPSASD